LTAFIIKGNFIHTPDKDKFEVHKDSYMLVENGVCRWIKKRLTDEERGKIKKENTNEGIRVYDYTDMLIIPSFIDLHLHAPQYIQMGIGIELSLIDWLDQYTFRIEERFADVNYAKKCYPPFVKELIECGTLRSVIFGTTHRESNQVLVEELRKRGLSALVGKVNMDRFAPVNLTETVEKSLKDTQAFIREVGPLRDQDIVPIITPRFAPSCTPDLLEGLGKMAKDYDMPVQSHLGENEDEVNWVKDLFEKELKDGEDTYSDVYNQYGLFGSQPTVMAHCIYLKEREIELAKVKNVFFAHCPLSNVNLTSGIMPLALYLDAGIKLGLGSDIGAGNSLMMNTVVAQAVQQSKIRHLYTGDRIVKESEAFYLATKGNGLFFSEVFNGRLFGSFEKGASFDALVIKDDLSFLDSFTPLEQLQRFIYRGNTKNIYARFLNGNEIS